MNDKMIELSNHLSGSSFCERDGEGSVVQRKFCMNIFNEKILPTSIQPMAKNIKKFL
jgi:hypothetical protein